MGAREEWISDNANNKNYVYNNQPDNEDDKDDDNDEDEDEDEDNVQ